MRVKATHVVLVIVLGACGFEKEQFLGDAAPPPVTVGFAQPTSLQDESSGSIEVIVRLSRPAPEPIAVNYAFSGGTATFGVDYTAEATGTLSFAPQQSEVAIPLTIAVDSLEEGNETIEITLSSPSGATLTTASHVITINASVLPRVAFTTATSSDSEATNLVLTLSLDTTPLLASTVDVVAVPTSSTGGAGFDWTMPTNIQVSFPPGTTTQTVMIPINDDALDEDDEILAVELAGESNIIIGTVHTHARTIVDNDEPPSVTISAATSMANEGNSGTATVSFNVSLTAVSGKPITVPITYDGGTATNPSDYTYVATGDLTFATNQDPQLCDRVKTITITVKGDTTDEDDQTVITSLGTPTNATLGGVTSNTHTIKNDDMSPTIQFMTASSNSQEGDSGISQFVYTLQLSSASEKTISFDVALTGTATYTDDYTTTPAATMNAATISVPPGTTNPTLTLNIIGETVVEGADETIVMTIATPFQNVRAAGNNQSRTHTIRDSDP